MNPEILRQIASQQISDQRARARRDRVSRTLAKALRGGHRHETESDGFVIPAIPDFVDGTFRQSADSVSTEAGSPVPAARTAA
jgi:hypothetical protein